MKVNKGTLTVTSKAFVHGSRLPEASSSSGAGVSPPLSISGVPEGTTSFALVAHDSDAPLIDGFTHLVVYGIPGDVREIAEGATSEFIQGINGMGKSGYWPVAPPPGHGMHYYYFHLYAIGGDVEFPAGLSMVELLARIDPDVINQARIVGTYSTD